MPIAPWFVPGVGIGPIAVPAHTRVAVVGYDNDTSVDDRLGIDLYRSLTVPADRKRHVTVCSQTRWFTTLHAQPAAANSLPVPNDAIRTFGLYRSPTPSRRAPCGGRLRALGGRGGCRGEGRWRGRARP